MSRKWKRIILIFFSNSVPAQALPGAPQKDKSRHREVLDLKPPKNQKEDKKTNAKTGVFELDWGLPRLCEIGDYFLLKWRQFF